MARYYADYYEVVFQSYETNSNYYRGTAHSGQGYISVAVPVGSYYEALAPAGDYTTKTLPAADFVDEADILPYQQKETVTVELSAFTPRWDTSPGLYNKIVYTTVPSVAEGAATVSAPDKDEDRTKSRNDFEFSASLTSNEYADTDTNGDRRMDAGEIWERLRILSADRIVRAAGDLILGASEISNSDNLSVTFNIAKFWPLMQANNNLAIYAPSTKGEPAIDGRTVCLIPRNKDSRFPSTPTALELDSTLLSSGVAVTDTRSTGGSITFFNLTSTSTITFRNKPLMILAKDLLPNYDTDAVLQFERYYYAFGVKGRSWTGGLPSRWTIRNGLSGGEEDGSAEYVTSLEEWFPTGKGTANGSRIAVRFGNGNNSDTNDTQVTY
jgi:hypothetical protein